MIKSVSREPEPSGLEMLQWKDLGPTVVYVD